LFDAQEPLRLGRKEGVLAMNARHWLPATGGVLMLVAAACAVRNPSPGVLDPKLARSTFIEESELLALVVSTRPMRFRTDRPYVPLEIAVVNKGLESLTLTRESFALVDGEGRRYPLATREELSRLYGSTDVDRRLAEAEPFVANRFSTYRRIPSNLTPGFDDPIGRDRLFIPRFGYILDFVYFPRPEGALVGQPLELFVTAPELPDPVFTRFALEGRAE
jgi:hypothetical protein